MADKGSGARIGVVTRTNVARAINVGSPGSVKHASSKQSLRIRQTDGRTETTEISEKKEA